MSSTLKLASRNTASRRLRPGLRPLTINWNAGHGQPVIGFSDGTSGSSACLRCVDAPCLRYSTAELSLPTVAGFPADGTTEVCVTGALLWQDDEPAPRVNRNLCISCGVCVLRCPVAAISLDTEGAAVADAEAAHFEPLPAMMIESEARSERGRFAEAVHVGVVLQESDAILEHAYSMMYRLLPTLHPRVPTHLTRNLLMAVGYRAAMRRLGDVNVRMDLVLWESPNGTIGTVEVEFEQGALIDTPRNILDNLAVLISRYKVPVDRAAGLVVTLALPNQRSEFWQVMEDLRQVLGIRSSVLTIGVLMFFVWSRATLELGLDGSFRAIPLGQPPERGGPCSIREPAERKLRRKIRIARGTAAVLESTK